MTGTLCFYTCTAALFLYFTLPTGRGSCGSFAITQTQGTGDVCSKGKKHDERGCAGMLLQHIIDQKMSMRKSERQPFAKEPPWVPQVSPKGPLR